ncbi:MAG: sigma-70 family RNA polymerase sigma factor [Tepidisphaeraceae bacterium]
MSRPADISSRMTDEHALVRKFSDTRSPEVFRELADRYAGLVFGTACRCLRDVHLAEDVTQAVFLLLSQKAGTIPQDRPVFAWLHRATRLIAASVRRAEANRRKREATVAAIPFIHATDAEDWSQMEPALDECLGALPTSDQDVLMLRFFERKAHRDIAGLLAISEDAATKRVNRAIEKLRELFRRRGLLVSAAAITAGLAQQSATAAPASLTPMLTLDQLSAASALIDTSTKPAPLLKTVIAALAVAAACVALLYATHRADAPIAATTASSALDSTSSRSMSSSAPLTIPFADTRVTIVGIAENRPNPPAWWSVDGSPITAPSFANRIEVGTDERLLQLVLRIEGPLRNRANRLTLSQADGSFHAATSRDDGQVTWTNWAIAVPATAEHGDLQLALATRDGDEQLIWDAEHGPAPGRESSAFVVTGVEQSRGYTRFMLRRGDAPFPTADSVRFYAELTDGHILATEGSSPTPATTRADFYVAQADVRRVWFEWRDDQRVLIRNVCLHSGLAPNPVTVEPDSARQPRAAVRSRATRGEL